MVGKGLDQEKGPGLPGVINCGTVSSKCVGGPRVTLIKFVHTHLPVDSAFILSCDKSVFFLALGGHLSHREFVPCFWQKQELQRGFAPSVGFSSKELVGQSDIFWDDII